MSTVAMRSLTRSLPVGKEAVTGILLSVPAESSLATQLSGLGYGPSQLFRSRLLKKTIPTSTTETFQMLPNSPSLEMVPIHRTTRERSDIGGLRFMTETSNISASQTFDLSPIINARIVCVRKSIAR